MNDFDDLTLAVEMLYRLRLQVTEDDMAWRKLYRAGQHLDRIRASILNDPGE